MEECRRRGYDGGPMPTAGPRGLTALLRHCRADDEHAWAELFVWADAIGRREISKYARSRKPEFEDMLQDFQAKLFQAVRKNQIDGTSDGEIAAYVIRIARNVAIDAHKGARGDNEELAEDIKDEGPRPDRNAELSQLRRRLEAILDEWAPKDSYLIVAKAEGVAAAVIAEYLKDRYGEIVTPATVDSRYSKLRKRLPLDLRP
jgi:RNA polymerase sigma factor (sigma-70 family)